MSLDTEGNADVQVGVAANLSDGGCGASAINA
jgi:hypothetical protein